MKSLTFSNGDRLAAIGLGTWKSRPGEVGRAVVEAVKAGYRHLDCAPIYGNEPEIGEALQQLFSEGTVKREDLWITSKLWNNAHRETDVVPALEHSLRDLKLDYLDLFLIHWPVAFRPEVQSMPAGPDDFLSLNDLPTGETWLGMERCVEQGKSRHIGLSNFSKAKIDALLPHTSIRPAMNQVELHPYLQQMELLNYCHDQDIHLTAYSPLGSKDRVKQMKKEDEPDLMKVPQVVAIAEKHGCSSAQVLIAWHLVRDCAVIPKSTNPQRIRENLAAAKIHLDADDLRKLAKLDRHYRFVDGSFWAREGSPYTLESLWDE